MPNVLKSTLFPMERHICQHYNRDASWPVFKTEHISFSKSTTTQIDDANRPNENASTA